VKSSEERLQKALDDAQEFASRHANEKTKLGNSPRWFQLKPFFDSFLASVKTLRRDLADNKAKALAEDRRALGQAFNQLVETYNLVSQFNR